MDIEKRNDVERVSRFDTVEAGKYWRAKEAVPHEGIEEGEVLLLRSLRWVDDAVHTVILRGHPSKYGKSRSFDYVDQDGNRARKYSDFREHRFLLGDFLDKFEYEPDAEKVRAEELAAVQARVERLREEIAGFASDPSVAARIVEEGMAQSDREDSRGRGLPALPPDVARGVFLTAMGDVASALSDGMSSDRMELLKSAAEQQRRVAAIKAEWMTEKTQAIAETIQGMTPFFEEQGAVALARTEDVREHVDRVTKGIENLGLYVGNDVHVLTVREGRGAPRDEPLTFVQAKLIMEEEFAVFADVDADFDFHDSRRFFDALSEFPGLVRQIFPTERCVVAMATSRRHVDYGDGLVGALNNAENAKVFLLVRDGENIHRVVSPVESHLGTSRLFPSLADDDSIFKGIDGRDIRFSDLAFTDRLARHQASALHYKRFLILAAGLDHRLKLFGDFYPPDEAFGFVTKEFQERHLRFIRDEDSSASLPGERRKPLKTFFDEHNAFLRPGSRIIADWRTLMNPTTAPAACFDTRVRDNYDGSFERRYRPADDFGVATVRESGGSLVVDVQVGGVARNGQRRSFLCKIDVSAYDPGYWKDYGGRAYLCIDKVAPEDLLGYVNDRTSRIAHLGYLRVFKSVARMLDEERRAETDMRDRMAQALIEGRVATADEAPRIVEEAVFVWRAGNRGRPLPSFRDGEAPAEWRPLLDLMHGLSGANDGKADEVRALVESHGRELLRAVTDKRGRVVAYAAPRHDERDDRIEPHAWTHRIVTDLQCGRLIEKSRSWAILPPSTASEVTIAEAPSAAEWTGASSIFAGPSAKKAAFDKVERSSEFLRLIAERRDEEAIRRLAADWLSARDDLTGLGKRVAKPDVVFAIGLVKDASGLRALTLRDADGPAMIARMMNEADRDRFRHEFKRFYAQADVQAELLDEAVARPPRWCVEAIPVGKLEPGDRMLVEPLHADADLVYAHSFSDVDPLIEPTLSEFLRAKGAAAWLSPTLAPGGEIEIDRVLGNKRPAGYGPYSVRTTTFWRDGDERTEPLVTMAEIVLEPGVFAPYPSGPDAERFFGSGSRTSLTRTVATRAEAMEIVARARDELGNGAEAREVEAPGETLSDNGAERWLFAPGKDQ